MHGFDHTLGSVGGCIAGDLGRYEPTRRGGIESEHVAQGLNYMKASGKTICLILNFQRPKLEWKRLVL